MCITKHIRWGTSRNAHSYRGGVPRPCLKFGGCFPELLRNGIGSGKCKRIADDN